MTPTTTKSDDITTCEKCKGTRFTSELYAGVCSDCESKQRKKRNPRAMGKVQENVLDAICRNPGWSYNNNRSGWLWDTPANTRNILNSLCRRGLVRLGDDERYSPTPLGIEQNKICKTAENQGT